MILAVFMCIVTVRTAYSTQRSYSKVKQLVNDNLLDLIFIIIECSNSANKEIFRVLREFGIVHDFVEFKTPTYVSQLRSTDLLPTPHSRLCLQPWPLGSVNIVCAPYEHFCDDI